MRVRLHVYRHFAHRLRRVAVEQYAALPADPADLRHRLDGAHFIVRVHDRNQHGALPDGRLHRAGIHQPIAVHRQPCYARAAPLQPAANVQHRLMLDGASDDVIALAGVRLRHAFDRQVIRLGRAAGEDNFLRRRADQPRDLLARFLHGLLRLPPELVVAAGRVSELPGEIRHHRRQHARVERGGGVMIQVNHWTNSIIAVRTGVRLLSPVSNFRLLSCRHILFRNWPIRTMWSKTPQYRATGPERAAGQNSRLSSNRAAIAGLCWRGTMSTFGSWSR